MICACEKILFMNKKRGRKNQKSNGREHEKTHSKFTDDNLKRKIKTHFHNYIIALLNSKLNFPKDEQKIVRFVLQPLFRRRLQDHVQLARRRL